ncbi:hypothetical protein WN51_01377 [Melipona quadrifasciata]|uniref:Uncharacterized protein n=1 Tax=Melipona quadrifasciata TaxID=166423 RepID=A0A0M9A002_9HYME|nr:hypothetical protein WN51_01377 [Melipona quadrifasciata]
MHRLETGALLQVTPVHNGTAPDIIYWYLGSPIIRLLVKLITLFAVALHYTGPTETAGWLPLKARMMDLCT